MIATIGEAHDLGWKLTIYCRFGKREGLKAIRECTARVELDLETLVWTRGREFPIVLVAFEPPPAETRMRA